MKPACWLVDWLVDCLFGWLVGRSVGCSIVQATWLEALRSRDVVPSRNTPFRPSLLAYVEAWILSGGLLAGVLQPCRIIAHDPTTLTAA
jgi:hypothetical protein